ncbi:hypothetical protein K456DRAFT_435678 [Colletotrichum gloeosporioides 23]|nr:hypothetical protein K456DRAFT_435678 [Colletotrichum gloeosporioides 23]
MLDSHVCIVVWMIWLLSRIQPVMSPLFPSAAPGLLLLLLLLALDLIICFRLFHVGARHVFVSSGPAFIQLVVMAAVVFASFFPYGSCPGVAAPMLLLLVPCSLLSRATLLVVLVLVLFALPAPCSFLPACSCFPVSIGYLGMFGRG